MKSLVSKRANIYFPVTNIILFVFILSISCNPEKQRHTLHSKESHSLQPNTELPEQYITNLKKQSALPEYSDQHLAEEFLKDSIQFIDSVTERFSDCCEEECRSWNYQDIQQIKSMVKKMVWEHPMDIAEVFEQQPCDITGLLTTSSGITYRFFLNAGGFITLISGEKEFNLGCRDPSLLPFFLSIKPTPEEFTKMMNEEDSIH
ncbi:MAG: hypothetical protein GC181_12665 [Bacteroidetes bacterium]|nr:hypothetical protein [Bacteroidota bacterium]